MAYCHTGTGIYTIHTCGLPSHRQRHTHAYYIHVTYCHTGIHTYYIHVAYPHTDRGIHIKKKPKAIKTSYKDKQSLDFMG